MTGDGWKRVHSELSRLARIRAGHDAEEARWLVEGRRHRVHERLGCGSYGEYLERVFGYTPRLAREKLRVAEALAVLPRLHDALAKGELSWSAVRELSRVAVAETEDTWIVAVRGRAVREIEDLVSGHRPGDRPDDAADPTARRHVVRLEISSEAMAALRDARRHLEDEVGHALDDDELVRQLAHHALGGPEPGRAAYQIAMTLCESCGRGGRDGGGRPHPVADSHIDAAHCDAQLLPATHAGRPIAAATQTIPPRVRRAVWRRDRGSCRVPGCRAARFLEVHHIVPRARGGTHDPANLLLLCSAHHARIHDGSLRLSGRAPDELEFAWPNSRFGRAAASVVPAATGVRGPTASRVGLDGSARQDASARDDVSAEVHESISDGPAAWTVIAPGSPGLAEQAVAALRRLGVGTSHARAAVSRALATAPDDIEALLRGALMILREHVYADRFAVHEAANGPARHV